MSNNRCIRKAKCYVQMGAGKEAKAARKRVNAGSKEVRVSFRMGAITDWQLFGSARIRHAASLLRLSTRFSHNMPFPVGPLIG
jgi:hypothetical protein